MQWLDQPCRISKEELSKEAISFFVRCGQSQGRISDSVSEDDVDEIICSYGLELDGKLTLAAGILFSPEPRRLNDAAFLKIGFFDEKNVLRREHYVEGPIIMLVDKALDILYYSYIQDTYGYDGPTAQRTIVHQYPREALKELIVNAMVHKDYRIQEPTTIRVYSDKLEIFCFGGLPKGWDVDKLLEEHVSIRRNPALAEVFFAAGYTENKGQGIEKVLEECRSNGNPEPEFRGMFDGLMVTIGEKIKKKPRVAPRPIFMIDKRSRAILDCIAENQFVTTREISDAIGASQITVKRRITAMVNAGVLRREGSTRSGRWIIEKD